MDNAPNPSVTSVKTNKTLFTGDSIVGRAKSLDDNVEVLSLPSGTTKQLLECIKSKLKGYKDIIFYVGFNDCSSGEDTDAIIRSYKELILEAKQHCSNGQIVVSALCPRSDDQKAMDKMNRLNIQLELLSYDMSDTFKFVSNHQAFYLQNGSINDGYLEGKGLHLNKAGMNRLFEILNLKGRVGYNFQPNKMLKQRQQSPSGHQLDQRPSIASSKPEAYSSGQNHGTLPFRSANRNVHTPFPTTSRNNHPVPLINAWRNGPPEQNSVDTMNTQKLYTNQSEGDRQYMAQTYGHSTVGRTDKEDVIYFWGSNDPLSNFYPCKLRVRGQEFHHSEGVYQHSKLADHGMEIEAEHCVKHTKAYDAMMAGKKANPPAGHWLLKRVDVMRQVLNEKWDQCPEYRDRLMSTGYAHLVEDTSHEFWARGANGDGLNMLGVIHMQKRADEREKMSQNSRYQFYQNVNRNTKQNMNSRHNATIEYNPPCLYCGITGHQQDTCWYGTYLQCRDCGGWGHKAKYCWYR